MKRIVVLLFTFVMGSWHACAQESQTDLSCSDAEYQVKLGRHYLADGIFDKAFDEFSQACQCGNSHGCYRLGILYHDGKGVAADYEKAKNLYSRISWQDGRGYNGIGNLYYEGLGVEQDMQTARLAYGLGCYSTKGYAVACWNLGIMYRQGEGVPRDYKRAVELFDRACRAEEMSANACTDLGVMYHNNWGVSRDIIKAIDFYKKACDAEDFSPRACQNLGDLHIDYGKGKQVFPNDPRLNLKKDRITAMEYYERACNAATPEAAYGCGPLGLIYLQGNDPRIEKNIAKAAELLHKGCDGTDYVDRNGCVNLALLYLYNHKPFVEQNFDKAVQLFERACDYNSDVGCQNLGSLYLEGKVVEKDESKSKRYYYKSCRLGNERICNYLKKIRTGGIRFLDFSDCLTECLLCIPSVFFQLNIYSIYLILNAMTGKPPRSILNRQLPG